MKDHSKRIFDSVVDLIGKIDNPTPMVRLNSTASLFRYPLYLKLEWMNPFGSVKDRTAYFLLKGLEEKGFLEGKDLVEPSSGNTGIALAALAALKKKKLIVTIPDGVPEEKKVLLRMLGAEVWPTPDDMCPLDHPRDGAIALAHSIVESQANLGKYVMPNQYENPDNVRAHYETTGPEIWNQTEGKVSCFFAGVGTCGTLTGVGRYLKEKNPRIRIIAVEPNPHHRLPGMKNLEEAKTPGIYDRSVVDETIRISDGEAYEMTKRLFREEALIVGPSTGAIVAGALKLAKPPEGLSVAISCDSGFRYLSFFSELLGEEGNPHF